MAGIFGYSREAVRVKVKKCEGSLAPEWRKFSVDPQITSLEVMYSILAKAFDIKTDFAISYRTKDPNGHELYLAVLSDWDLDAAFLRAHNLSITTSIEPCLYLTVDIKPFSEAPDWDVATSAAIVSGTGSHHQQMGRDVSPLQQSIGAGQKYVQNMHTRLPGLIMNQMEKTFSMVTRALNFVEDQNILQPPRAPLSDTEFRCFLDSVGQIVFPHDLRNVIYSGGIDPSLRRVVWKHILNVYPDGMTGRERMDYMKQKAAEYQRLRDTWRTAVQRGSVAGELAYVTSMVRKDVLRTDRLHPFYAGSDDNQNIAALFNILTTYALNHPVVSYCQGMSDIASPLLVTMGDEAQAYICFCAVMRRLNANFLLDGVAMTLKFTHLSKALQYYDPEFYEYLKLQQADDLLFCYRWLLLEMKREFAFDDSLRMLEVLWSALPPEPPAVELPLFDKEFEEPPPLPPPPVPPSAVAAVATAAADDVKSSSSPIIIMRQPRETAYTKLCALRRQSSAASLASNSSSNASAATAAAARPNRSSLDCNRRLHQSLEEPQCVVRNCTKPTKSLDETKLAEVEAIQTRTPSPLPDIDDVFSGGIANNDCNGIGTTNENSDVLTSVNQPHHHHHHHPHPHPPHHHVGKSKSTTLNNISALSKQLHHHHRKGGHFKDLKERIAASKKDIFNAMERGPSIVTASTTKEDGGNDNNGSPTTTTTTTTQKVVKNFNEFLNFASIQKAPSRAPTHHFNHNSHIPTITTTTTTTLSDIHPNKYAQNEQQIQNVDNSNASSSPPTNVEEFVTTTTPKLQLNLSTTADRRCSIDGSSPDDSQEYYPMTTSMTRELRLEMESLDRCVFGDDFPMQRLNAAAAAAAAQSVQSSAEIQCSDDISYTQLSDANLEEIIECPSSSAVDSVQKRVRDNQMTSENALKRISACSANTDVFLWENPLHQCSPSPSTFLDFDGGGGGGGDHNKPTTTTVADVYAVVATVAAASAADSITPDEQKELELDDDMSIAKSFIETTALGRKSVTPIRFVRRPPPSHFDLINRSSATTTTHSSSCSANNSDSSDADDYSWNGSKSLPKNIPPSPVRQSQSNHQLMTTMTAAINELSTSVEEAAEAAQLSMSASSNSAGGTSVVVGALPGPLDFGGGNPFLMFLCLTLLLQHRNYVIKSNMDYNEMAMHFDKMVRKHNVTRVLNQARRMYADYLKAQKMENVVGLGVVSDPMASSSLSSTAATTTTANDSPSIMKNTSFDVKI